MRINNRGPGLDRNSQRGMATILMVLLVGLSISAMSVGILMTVRSSQDKQIAAQAQVHSQAAVWAEAEFFSAYFQQLSTPQVVTLQTEVTAANGPLPATAPPLFRTIPGVDFTATILSLTTLPNGHPNVVMELTAQDNTAGASSRIEVAYELTPKERERTKIQGGMNFNRGLKSEGGIVFTPQAGPGHPGEAVLSIKGLADLTAVLQGVDTVNASGDIILGSSSTRVRQASSNGNIILKAAAAVWGTATAKKSIQTKDGSGCYIGTARANEDILYHCGGPISGAPTITTTDPITGVTSTSVMDVSKVTELNARRDVTIDTSAMAFTRVVAGRKAKVTGVQSGATNIITTLEAGGIATESPTIEVDSATRIVKNISSQGTLKCPTTVMTDGFPTNLITVAARVFTTCPSDSKFTPSPSNQVTTLIEPITDIDLNPYEVDVWQDDANYIVSHDASGIHVKVTGVDKITGTTRQAIEDGDYILGQNGTAGKPDYLCKTAGCTNDYHFCKGDPNYCLTWQNGTFILNDTLVPGVVIFKGNLLIKGTAGTTATILATGNIKTEDSIQISALNYAGKSGFASGRFGAVKPVYGVCDNLSPDFSLIPRDYCLTATPGFKSFPMGNVALKAGGRKPIADGGSVDAADANRLTYKGGDIWLSAASTALGTVLAGNFFRSEGEGLIKGYVSASGLRVTAAGGDYKLDGNALTAKTDVNVSNLPGTFDPADVLTGGAVTNGSSNNVHSVKITGARYR